MQIEDKELREAINAGVHSSRFQMFCVAVAGGFLIGAFSKKNNLNRRYSFYMATAFGSLNSFFNSKNFSINEAIIGGSVSVVTLFVTEKILDRFD
ncbi:unnamed protein product [Brachionus calyciflorus]|uniref:Uncharacterized protein n=1 Tax=Brachionus calyciflorus TaxID=104777 RepID=A0A814DTX3_9BILA|nr:unnamed protein product [Brachionus calyciflorus]